jgi:uncharacterized membrane protein
VSDPSGLQHGSQEDEQQTGHRTYRRGVGIAFDRVAFFTDAVFAIAMTLLIVAVELPELVGPLDDPSTLIEPLKAMAPQLISFFLAFLLLGRYWMAHHAFFAVLEKVDRRLIALNLIYLSFVAFLPFPTELIGKYEENPISVTLFALTMAAISGMETVIFRHAHRERLLVHPMTDEVYRYGMIQSTVPVALFLVSIPIAFWDPVTRYVWLIWVASLPIGLLIDRRQRDQARKHRQAMRPPTRA